MFVLDSCFIFRVSGSGFRVPGSRFRVQGSGFLSLYPVFAFVLFTFALFLVSCSSIPHFLKSSTFAVVLPDARDVAIAPFAFLLNQEAFVQSNCLFQTVVEGIAN